MTVRDRHGVKILFFLPVEADMSRLVRFTMSASPGSVLSDLAGTSLIDAHSYL
jgi:hypothetical protein